MAGRIRPILRRVIGFAVGFLVALGTITAAELGRSERSDTQVWELAGSLDMFEYCLQADGDLRAVLRSDDAYGWRCMGRRNDIWGFEPVDVNAACTQQYGPDSRAQTTDPTDALSWECLIPQ